MKNVMERILAVLTPEQLAQWQKLTGPPFTCGFEFMHPDHNSYREPGRE